MRIVAVSPSLRGTKTELRTLCDALRHDGIEPWVVPTGSSAEAGCREADIPFIEIGDNPGFGAAVTHGLDRCGRWDWALILNDDIHLAAGALSTVVADLAPGSSRTLIYLDPVPAKPMPGLMSTLGQVSLWSAVTKRFRPSHTPDLAQAFRPFSIALVSHGLWEALGGLDESMPYTFEDADFGRRAVAEGAEVEFPTLEGIVHPASSTSRRHVDTVMPVAVWSAMNYLAKWYVPRPVARAMVAAALVARIPMVAAAPLDRASHLRGLINSLRIVVTDEQPQLPAFTSV